MKEPIKVPAKVFYGLETVRQSGITNMFMVDQVQKYAFLNGDDDTVTWIEDNPGSLTRGVIAGVESEDGDTEQIKRDVAERIANGKVDYLYEED